MRRDIRDSPETNGLAAAGRFERSKRPHPCHPAVSLHLCSASPRRRRTWGVHAAACADSPEREIKDATRDILPRSGERPRRSGEGPRMTGHVLIVDDDQSMAETLTKAMTRRG